MDERLFTRLTTLLADENVVVASVLATRGAVPRKAGSRMLVTQDASEFSIGGGLAEARVVDAARTLLHQRADTATLDIDLSGQPGAAGICGGRMQLALRRWWSDADRARAASIAASLQSGTSTHLYASDIDAETSTVAQPNARLLIVGGGHCSLALFELAQHLDFDQWIFDPRPHPFASADVRRATHLHGAFGTLARAFETDRAVYVALLNRDYHGDVAALDVLQHQCPAFLGMMGSRRRIAEVRAAFPPDAAFQQRLHAPIGLPIDAHTPHEIAVSIVAQLVQERRRNAS